MPIVFDIDNRKTPMNQLIDFIESMPDTDYPKTTIMAKAMELVAEEKKQIQAAVNWGAFDFEGSNYTNTGDFYKARYGDTINETHTEIIKCPECGDVQNAIVEHGRPFWTWIHICKKCNHTIMESEWDEVE